MAVKEFQGAEANKACKGRKVLMQIIVYEPDEEGNHAVQVKGKASDEEIQAALKVVCNKFGIATDPDWFAKLLMGKMPEGD